MNADARSFTLREIAERLGGDLEGDATRVIRGVRPVADAGADDIAFLDNPKYLPAAVSSEAAAVVVPGSLPAEDLARLRDGKRGLILVREPYVAFAELLDMFHPRVRDEIGISPTANVATSAVVGADTNVHSGAFVGEEVEIGDRCDVHPGAYIGRGVRIGSNCAIHPNVTIYEGCRVGDRVTLHAGVVVGGDGFGYAQRAVEDNPAEPVVHRKVPQIGTVVIEDDVEIGANSTIDRATMEETRICRGTKIDNLVMIGHNCRVGRHTILVGQVGISGSTTIGDYVTIAGQAGLVGHIKVGDGVTIGAQSGITKDIAPGKTVFGSPAMDIGIARRVYAILDQLPDYRKRILQLEKRLAELEGPTPNPSA